MRTNQIVKCDYCSKEEIYTKMKRINGNWRCEKCVIRKRKENREHLKRDVLGIRKRSDLEKEWKIKREESEKLRKIIESKAPKIKGQKIKRVCKQLHFYLTSVEKQFLYRKYQTMGLSNQEMKERIENDSKFLNDLVKELREKNKTEDEISNKFKEEFSKLIMENGNGN